MNNVENENKLGEITFSILSSCVTRDGFQYLPNNYKVSSFYQYCSLFSYMQDNKVSNLFLELTQNDVINGTPWQKRCLLNDLCRTTMDNTCKYSDFMLIDMSDGRFPLYNIAKESEENNPIYLTNENVLKKNLDNLKLKLFSDSKMEEVLPWNLDSNYYSKCINSFTSEILRHFKPNQIILNKCYMVDCYFDKNNIKRFINIDTITKQNCFLKKLNKDIEEKLNNCHVIEMPDFILADKDNKWGLYPLHYHNDYYKYLAEAIKIIVERKDCEVQLLEKERILCTHRFTYNLNKICNKS